MFKEKKILIAGAGEVVDKNVVPDLIDTSAVDMVGIRE